MTPEEAISLITEFKGIDLTSKLGELKNKLKGNTKISVLELNNVFEAALELKKISSQVDEIVHATGIIKCLPKILMDGETIISVSLAAGSDDEGFDLVTDKRIAEFKFALWQEKGPNGSRRRDVYKDFVNLLIYETDKSKELYVFNPSKIKRFLSSKKAQWKNVLSKSGGVEKKLAEFLHHKSVNGIFLADVYSLSTIEIKDMSKYL